jgi:hypothetical protein
MRELIEEGAIEENAISALSKSRFFPVSKTGRFFTAKPFQFQHSGLKVRLFGTDIE